MLTLKIACAFQPKLKNIQFTIKLDCSTRRESNTYVFIFCCLKNDLNKYMKINHYKCFTMIAILICLINKSFL